MSIIKDETEAEMRALLVHGAGASPLFWRVFQETTSLDTTTFSYDVASEDFESISRRCASAALSRGCDFIVGHSFGGVVAWRAAELCPSVVSCASISSPWGGSTYCDVVDFLTVGAYPNRFFSNVARSSPHLIRTRLTPPPRPWLNVVTNKNPLHAHPPNDGVLTVRSQESLYVDERVSRVYLPFGHTEVLLTPQVVEAVDPFLIATHRNSLRDRSSWDTR